MDAGIYLIRNCASKDKCDCYVGQSYQLRWRMQGHRLCILKRKHPNARLDKAIKEYGPLCFDVSVLEICDREKLNSRESHWAQQLSPNYNIASLPVCNNKCSGRQTRLPASYYGYGIPWPREKPRGLLFTAYDTSLDYFGEQEIDKVLGLLSTKQIEVLEARSKGESFRVIGKRLGISSFGAKLRLKAAKEKVEKYLYQS